MLLASQQRGASGTGIFIMVIALVVFLKLGLAILPAQIGHYQLKKALTAQIDKSNANNEDTTAFMSNLGSQWRIDGHEQKPEDVIRFVDETPGTLTVKLKYNDTHNLYGHVDIVSRFDETIGPKADKATGKSK